MISIDALILIGLVVGPEPNVPTSGVRWSKNSEVNRLCLDETSKELCSTATCLTAQSHDCHFGLTLARQGRSGVKRLGAFFLTALSVEDGGLRFFMLWLLWSFFFPWSCSVFERVFLSSIAGCLYCMLGSTDDPSDLGLWTSQGP